MIAAGRDPDGLAVIDADGRTTSFGELWRYSLGVARYLQRHANLGVGQCVAVGSQGGSEAAAALFGALITGALVSPIGVGLRSHDAAHQLSDSGAVYALAPKPLLGAISEAIALGRLPGLHGTLPFNSVLELADSDPSPPENVTVDPDRDIAVLPFSSGTSGLPRGVMITHSQLVAATRQQLVTSALHRGARVLNLRLSWTRLHLTVAAGATYIAPSGSDARSIAAQIERYRPSDLLVKPSTLGLLVEEQLRRPRDFSSLRSIETGAEALAEHLQREATETFGCPVFQSYHQTETCGSSNRARPDDARPGSVGWPVPDSEERIVNLDTGEDVPIGGEGELLIRGPQVMHGYLGQADADAAAFDNGWFRTGDLARQDADGQVVIVDRIKDLIKFQGIPIAPAEIERVLLRHPAVSEVAVIPTRSAQGGERPKAFVVLKSGETVAPVALIAMAAAELAPHKLLDQVEIIEAMPRNASGKVLRRELINRRAGPEAESWADFLADS